MTQEWLEVAKILGADPTARVTCPSCHDEAVSVTDQYVPGDDMFERWLSCRKCGGGASLRKSYKKQFDLPAARSAA